jgi:hypothetical protein
MKSRAETLTRRVRESELFPRIRDVEQAMLEDEKKFMERRLKRKKKRKKLQDKKVELPSIFDKWIPKDDEGENQLNFFSKFIVNSDPSNSKYMPFDEVYYPSIFNEDVRNCPPHAIDNIWMLAFEHLENEGRPK